MGFPKSFLFSFVDLVRLGFFTFRLARMIAPRVWIHFLDPAIGSPAGKDITGWIGVGLVCRMDNRITQDGMTGIYLACLVRQLIAGFGLDTWMDSWESFTEQGHCWTLLGVGWLDLVGEMIHQWRKLSGVYCMMSV